MTYAAVEHAVEEASFAVLGAFHPEASDGVPGTCGTLVLVGNAGPAMWKRFETERATPRTSMDAWTETVLTALARNLGGAVLFPFARPPLPFLAWARRAGAGSVSPLGMNIRPDHGLWHAFRGALVMPDRLDLPPSDALASPCTGCMERPCLTACPVNAFSGHSYAVEDCTAHISTPAGDDCMARGCKARLACPAGADYRYLPEQARFHMTAFLAARLSGKGR